MGLDPLPAALTATSTVATTAMPGKDAAAAPNPFAALLCDLTTGCPPAADADIRPTDAQSTMRLNDMITTTDALDATPSALMSGDVLAPGSFNARLALVRAAPAPAAPPPVTALTPAQGDTASSLLALLGNTKPAAAPAASADVAVSTSDNDAAQPGPSAPATTSLPTGAVALIPVATPDIAPELKPDTDGETAEPEATPAAAQASPLPQPLPIVHAPVAQPAAHLPAVPATAEDEATVPVDILRAETPSASEKRSLFDRLSDKAEASVSISADGQPAPAVAVPQIAQPETRPASAAQAVTAPPLVQTTEAAPQPAAPVAAEVPRVTMRPHNEAHLIDGVSVLVARAAKSKISEFVVRIDPPELGRIDVQLKMNEDGSVKAVIASDNASTYDLLRREAGTIERALADSGLKAGSDSLTFNLRQNDSGQDRNGRAPSQDRAAYPSSDGAVESDRDNIPAAILAPLRQRYDSARINITA